MEKIQEMFFSFKGRLNRWPFFTRSIMMSLAIGIINWFFRTIAGNGAMSATLPAMVGNILSFVGWVGSISLTTRRLHDLNKSGWWQLIFQVPLVFILIAAVLMFFAVPDKNVQLSIISMVLIGVAFFLIIAMEIWILFWKGTTGDNKYGPDPLAKKAE